jgi:hypothetical protein
VFRHTALMKNFRVRATAICLIFMLPLLKGCGTIGAFIGDTLPAAMGGLPADAPPRPSDPRYAEYERAQRAKAEGPAKTDTAKPDAIR